MFLLSVYAVLILVAAVIGLAVHLHMGRRRAAKSERMSRCLSQAIQRETPVEVPEEYEVA